MEILMINRGYIYNMSSLSFFIAVRQQTTVTKRHYCTCGECPNTQSCRENTDTACKMDATDCKSASADQPVSISGGPTRRRCVDATEHQLRRVFSGSWPTCPAPRLRAAASAASRPNDFHLIPSDGIHNPHFELDVHPPLAHKPLP